MNILTLTDKRRALLVALCAAVLLCVGCKKETVTQGVAGNVTFFNYWPSADNGEPPYGTIYFFPLDSANCTAEDVFTSDWATIAKTDARGRYSVALDTGDYSVIVCAATGMTTWPAPPPVHVDPGSVTRYDISVNLGMELY